MSERKGLEFCVLNLQCDCLLEPRLFAFCRSSFRSTAESQLTFLGLLVFENPLKPTSASTILTIQNDAKIPTKMCTGDAVLTAISCAKECHILPSLAPVYVPRIRDSGLRDVEKLTREAQVAEVEWINVNDENKFLDPYTLDPIDQESKSQDLKLKDVGLAITGETFKFLLAHSSKETLERILVHAQVFARMSPEQKGELVENLHALGWTTAFCGDGANDMSGECFEKGRRSRDVESAC